MKYLLLTVLVMIFGFSAHTSVKKTEEKIDLPKVFVEKIKKSEIAREVESWGRITPVKLSKIYSPVEGVLVNFRFKAGKRVKKGQVLATIKQNVIGVEIMPVKLRAPISGFLYRPAVTENTLIARNAHLFTVYDPTMFKLETNLSPKDGEDATSLSRVDVEIDGKTIEGRIGPISENIDHDTGTRTIEIFIAKDKSLKLRPGMLAKAMFKFNAHQGILLEKKYVQKRAGKKYVRLLGKEGVVRELEVKVLNRIKSSLEIAGGELKMNDELIIKSSVEPLLDKQKVEVVKRESQKDEVAKKEKISKKI